MSVEIGIKISANTPNSILLCMIATVQQVTAESLICKMTNVLSRWRTFEGIALLAPMFCLDFVSPNIYCKISAGKSGGQRHLLFD